MDALLGPLGAVLGAIVGAVALYLAGRKAGRSGAKLDATRKDNDHAEDIRRRVDRDLADRVRRYDGSGWRD